MQKTLFKTLTFEAFLLAPVIDKEIAKTNTSFWLAELRALVDKRAFLVTIVIGGSAYVLIFPTRCLVAATIILSQVLGRVDLNGRRGALRPRAAGAAIRTIPIAPTLLIVPAKSLGLSGLGIMRRHGLYLLGAE